MLTHTITLSFSLSTTFNSLWKRQVQTLIEPEPDLAPALSVRPAVLSNPLRSMSSQPASQQASSQSTRLQTAGRGGLRLSPGPRYSRASLGSLDRPQRGTAQCQAQSLHHWCRMCFRQDGEGTPESLPDLHPVSPHSSCSKPPFPPRTPPPLSPAPFSVPPPLLNPPSLPPSFLLHSHPLLASSILELLWFRSLSFPSSILPAPAVLQPTTVSYWFIDCCLPVGERPQSPSALPCMDLSSLSPPFFPSLSLTLHPLHLPIDAVAVKHELEKAGESNLLGEIGFTFSYTRFVFLSLALFYLHPSFLCFAFVCPSCPLHFHPDAAACEC